MKEEIQNLYSELKNKFDDIAKKGALNKISLEELKVEYLGKKGKVTSYLKKIGSLAAEQRKEVGQVINQVKRESEVFIKEKLEKFSNSDLLDKKIDIHLSGKKNQLGRTHPLTITKNKVLEFFNQMGFITVEGPEIETDYYNFEALNIPKGHPARDNHDSFYLKGNNLLRTQTSPVQIRVMEEVKPPLAIVSPGRVFRRDTLDATHSFCFNQIEGLLVDEKVTFSDLKGVLTLFCKTFFGDALEVRFRPDYFPFTEPSCEIAIKYPDKKDGWLEILGAGMVNPLVLENCKIDPKKYSGFAFGLGVERIAMLTYGIKDIRLFYENDFSFLEQF